MANKSDGRHIGDRHPKTACRPLDDAELQQIRAEVGDIDTSPEAAREIAENIENGGGFWGKRKN